MDKNERKTTKKRWRLWILLPLLFLLLPLLLAALLLVPPIQSWAVQRSLAFASHYVEAELSLGGVYLEPFKTLRLHQLLIRDQQSDTLLFVDVLRLDVRSFDRKAATLKVDELELRNAYFNLYNLKGQEYLNLQFLIDALSGDSSDTSNPLAIHCDDLILNGLRFRYNDQNVQDTKKGQVDFNHLYLSDLSGRLSDISVEEGVAASMHGLHFKERSGLQLRCLNTDFLLNDTAIQLNDLALVTNRSILEGSYRMDFASFESFQIFEDAVSMHAILRSSSISFEDIAFFAPSVYGLLTPLKVSGKIDGSLSKLSATFDTLHFANGGRLIGKLKVRGLPDPDAMMIDARLEELRFSSDDIGALGIPSDGRITQIVLPEALDALGMLVYKGRLTGFINDFTTYGSLSTALGLLETDINLKVQEQIVYRGKLASKSFSLDGLVPDLGFGMTAFNLLVNGREFDPASIDLDAKGEVARFDWLGYPYQDISVDGHFERGQVEGNLSMNDPNARIDFTGQIDLNAKVPQISCVSRFSDLRPGQLNLIPQDTFGVFNANVDLVLGGERLDELTGVLHLSEFSYENQDQLIRLDSIVLRDRMQGEEHRITLNTEIAQLLIEGETHLAALHLAAIDILQHYGPELLPAFDLEQAMEDQDFRMVLTVDKKAELLRLIHPDLNLGTDLRITAQVSTIDHSFQLDMDSISWSLGEVKAENMLMHIAPKDGSLFNEIRTEKFSLGNDYFLEQFGLRNQLKNDSLASEIFWSNNTVMADSGMIKLLAFRSDQHPYNLKLQDLYARIAGETWKNYAKATLKADTNYLIIDGFDVRSERGLVQCSGQVSGKPSDQLSLKIKDFDLSYLSNFGVDQNAFEGAFTGSMRLSKQNGAFIANSSVFVKDLVIDDVEVGSIEGVTAYDSDERAIRLGLDLDYKQNKNVKLSGQVFPFKKLDQLDLKLSLTEFRAAVLEPFISDYASDLNGIVEGSVEVEGMLNAPLISGQIALERFAATVGYLNTKYAIPSAMINVSDGFIGMDHAKIIDEKGNEAFLTATVFHTNFSEFNYDIFVDAKEFMALNTTLAQNDDYYGQANVTGDVDISGYQGSTNIAVRAETERGTQLSIPLSSSDEVGDIDYIRFVPPPDAKVMRKSNDDKVAEDLTALNLDFQLSVDDQAEVQIIFDQKIGDVIKVRGNGDMLMKIDNRGSFNMYGDYTMSGGDYLFTLQNLINKRFSVNPGSKITWNGSPTEAEVDLTAVYNLRAAPINLTASVGDTSEVYKKRMPVEVFLSMKGPLLEPVITFDVGLPSLPEADLANQLLDPRTTSEQDMNQQVFALLLTNNFFAQGSGVSSLSSVGQNTTYEMVSNQFSNWISQYFENVDVGVMVGNQTELNVSTELLNDRMLVELNGSVQGEQGGTENSNSFAGEFNIEYKINKDGSLRARVFNEANNYNPTNLNQSPYTQGIGAFYRREFDRFGDLFRALFNQKKKPASITKEDR